MGELLRLGNHWARRFRRVLLVPAALLLALGLAACSNPTPQEYFTRAQEYANNGEMNAAVLELKNALLGDPQFGEARLMLGKIYERRGDYANAIKELERALDLNQSADDVLPPLMISKLNVGHVQEVIGELEGGAQLTPRLEAVLGDAYLFNNDFVTAENLYKSALERDPNLAVGHQGLGKVKSVVGDFSAAAEAYSQAAALDPEDRSTWLLYGENALVQPDLATAYEAFAKATELPGGELIGVMGTARTLLIDRKLDDALAKVNEVLDRAPNYPLGNYLKGLIQFQLKDYEAAEQSIELVQATVPDHPGSLYLNGAIQYQLDKPAQAQDQLNRYLTLDPGNNSVRKLLASMYQEEQNFEAAVDTLSPVGESSQDAQLLAMLGTAYLGTGDQSRASEYFQRAVALEPDMAALRNQLALSLLSSGDKRAAEAELEAAVELDGEQFQSDYLIAMLRIQEGDQDAALAAVERLLEKDPEQPIGYNLRGGIKLAQGDLAGGVADFELALVKDPAFEPATRNLAVLAVNDGDLERADAVWANLLEANPESLSAILALSQLAAERGDFDAQKQLLNRAVTLAGDAALPRTMLAERLLAEREFDQALRIVDAGLQQNAESVRLMLMKARIHLAQGRPSSARIDAGKVQGLLAKNKVDLETVPQVAYPLGLVWMSSGDRASARTVLEAANTGFKGQHVDTLILLARLSIAERDTLGARQKLDTLKTLEVKPEAILELEGDVLVSENKLPDAMEKFIALREAGIRSGATKQALLMERMGDTAGARQVMQNWIDINPNDAGMKLLVANSHLNSGEQSQAVEIYEGLKGSENPVVLNNLAWLYHEKGDTKALELAERAYRLAPENADIADTLGWILVEQGKHGEGLEYLKSSIASRDQNPSVQYHLGVAHQRSGDLHSARLHLRKALNLGEFPEADAARKLLEEL